VIYQRSLAPAMEYETFLFTIDGSSVAEDFKGKSALAFFLMLLYFFYKKGCSLVILEELLPLIWQKCF
jgi:hypothetical protein